MFKTGCSHKWEKVAVRFTPPIFLKTIQGCSERTLYDLTFGFTTIEERCSICGKTEYTQVSGNQAKKPRDDSSGTDIQQKI